MSLRHRAYLAPSGTSGRAALAALSAMSFPFQCCPAPLATAWAWVKCDLT